MTKPTKSTTKATTEPKPKATARKRKAAVSSPAELAPVATAVAAPLAEAVAAPVHATAPSAATVAEIAPDASFADRVRSRTGKADLLVFRVGTELFAAALTAIEEALELPRLSHLPEMPPSMLGVISLRGRMLPAYSPARHLGVALAREDAAALVLRAGDRRVALAVDDVDDVLTVDLNGLRPPPTVAGEERDAVLLGVADRGGVLVAVLDADALVTACLFDQALEIA
jgi:purine-binding chemotaxis protein CheW